MPYGLPKNLETDTNKKWMEECVESVIMRGNNIEKEQAIAICKRQLIDKQGNKTRANIGVLNKILEANSENRRGK